MNYKTLSKDRLIELLEKKDQDYKKLTEFNTQLINGKSDLCFELSKYKLDYREEKTKLQIEKAKKEDLKKIALNLLHQLHYKNNNKDTGTLEKARTEKNKLKIKRTTDYKEMIRKIIKENNEISIKEISIKLKITRTTLYNLNLIEFIKKCKTPGGNNE